LSSGLRRDLNNIGHAFRTFDTDGNSKISFQEFWHGLDKVGIPMEMNTCKEIFDYLDENNDCYIEFGEF
jgi:Ca2+-binding EF-hand superfamily protein